MGFYTELFFNEIEVAEGCLHALRDSALKRVKEGDCPWSYMLNYIYVNCSDYRTIDLQISDKLGKELATLHDTPPEPLYDPGNSEARDGGEDEPTYKLEWYPYDGFSQKWYDVDGFVSWVCAFCTGGQVFQLTQEEGGGLWGWELSEGKFRELELRPKGRWRKSSSSKFG